MLLLCLLQGPVEELEVFDEPSPSGYTPHPKPVPNGPMNIVVSYLRQLMRGDTPPPYDLVDDQRDRLSPRKV